MGGGVHVYQEHVKAGGPSLWAAKGNGWLLPGCIISLGTCKAVIS